MATYEQSTNVDAPANALFDYLADISNLPKYFLSMTSAESVGGDKIRTTARVDADQDGDEEEVVSDAWFRVNRDEKRLEWGSPGPNDYHGGLAVIGEGDTSSVSVHVHTVHVDGRDINQGLRETLANIKRLVETG